MGESSDIQSSVPIDLTAILDGLIEELWSCFGSFFGTTLTSGGLETEGRVFAEVVVSFLLSSFCATLSSFRCAGDTVVPTAEGTSETFWGTAGVLSAFDFGGGEGFPDPTFSPEETPVA